MKWILRLSDFVPGKLSHRNYVRLWQPLSGTLEFNPGGSHCTAGPPTALSACCVQCPCAGHDTGTRLLQPLGFLSPLCRRFFNTIWFPLPLICLAFHWEHHCRHFSRHDQVDREKATGFPFWDWNPVGLVIAVRGIFPIWVNLTLEPMPAWMKRLLSVKESPV